jgi:hypothetical protein
MDATVISFHEKNIDNPTHIINLGKIWESMENAFFIEKNLVIDYQRYWVDKAKSYPRLNPGRLKALLDDAKKEIKNKFPLENEDRLELLISNINSEVEDIGKKICHDHLIEIKDLFREYFGGYPEFEKNQLLDGKQIKADVFSKEIDRATIWYVIPSDENSLRQDIKTKDNIKVEADQQTSDWERALGISCYTGLIIDGHMRKSTFPAILKHCSNQPSTKPNQQITQELVTNNVIEERGKIKLLDSSESKINEKKVTILQANQSVIKEPEVTINQDFSTKTLGRVTQDRSKQLDIKMGKKTLWGYLYEETAAEVNANDILVARDQNRPELKLICQVREMKCSPRTAAIQRKSIEEFVCQVILEPKCIVQDSKRYEVPSANYDGCQLFWPDEGDFEILHNQPKNGIPIGHLISGNGVSTKIPFKYDPYQGYRSIFVCGGQGTGKTNFLRYLIKTYSTNSIEKPSMIVLDVEGQFVGIKDIFDEKDKSTVQIRRLTVASSDVKGDVTLSSREVMAKSLPCFVPDLQTGTIEQLERITQEVLSEQVRKGEEMTIQKLLREIDMKAQRDGRLHPGQRSAISRVVVSPTFNLFDKPGIPPLDMTELVKPGQISVVDVSDLSEDEQRVVAIYLMTMLFEGKMKNGNEAFRGVGVLLMMDEAHRLFPQNKGFKKDYVTRVAKFVGEVVHRGRKRNYGIILATQSPSDISKDVVDLCETKVFFRTVGCEKWLKEQIGDGDIARKISILPVYHAFAIVKGRSSEAVEIGFPNVSDPPIIRCGGM